MKPSHTQDRHSEGDSTRGRGIGGERGGRRGGGRGGGRGLKLEVAIPTSSGGGMGGERGRGGETGENESATYSSDFTKDSIEG